MLLTVIFDRQHHVLPAHIQEVPRKAVCTKHGNLSSRLGEAGVDQEQPQPGFLRRLSSRVDQSQRYSNCRRPRAWRWLPATSQTSRTLKSVAAASASRAATARPKCFRVGQCRKRCVPVSSSRDRRAVEIHHSIAGRGASRRLAGLSHCARSIRPALYRPPTWRRAPPTPSHRRPPLRRCDHSQAAMARCRSDGSSRLSR